MGVAASFFGSPKPSVRQHLSRQNGQDPRFREPHPTQIGAFFGRQPSVACSPRRSYAAATMLSLVGFCALCFDLSLSLMVAILFSFSPWPAFTQTLLHAASIPPVRLSPMPSCGVERPQHDPGLSMDYLACPETSYMRRIEISKECGSLASPLVLAKTCPQRQSMLPTRYTLCGCIVSVAV